jgi:hypothetical protein
MSSSSLEMAAFWGVPLEVETTRVDVVRGGSGLTASEGAASSSGDSCAVSSGDSFCALGSDVALVLLELSSMVVFDRVGRIEARLAGVFPAVPLEDIPGLVNFV